MDTTLRSSPAFLPAPSSPEIRWLPADWVLAAYLAAETGLVAAAWDRLPLPGLFLAGHFAALAGVLAVGRLGGQDRAGWRRVLRHWYAVALLPLVFKQLYWLVPAVHPVDYDVWAMELDKRLFGLCPGVWFDDRLPAWAGDALQVCYTLYFAFPLLSGVPLYRRLDRGPFRSALTLIVTAYLASYAGYFLVPMTGPLRHEAVLGHTAPIPLTAFGHAMRDTLVTLEQEMRDCFPSGHTLVALLTTAVAFRWRAPTRWILAVLATGLVVSTVALRYHYAIDVLAGAVLAGSLWVLVPPLHRRLETLCQT